MKNIFDLTHAKKEEIMDQRKVRVSFVMEYTGKFINRFFFSRTLALQLTQCLVATSLPVSNSETKCIKSSISHAKLRMSQMLTITFGLEYLSLKYTVAKFEDNMEPGESLFS